jgi:hypothetical protein
MAVSRSLALAAAVLLLAATACQGVELRSRSSLRARGPEAAADDDAMPDAAAVAAASATASTGGTGATGGAELEAAREKVRSMQASLSTKIGHMKRKNLAMQQKQTVLAKREDAMDAREAKLGQREAALLRTEIATAKATQKAQTDCKENACAKGLIAKKEELLRQVQQRLAVSEEAMKHGQGVMPSADTWRDLQKAGPALFEVVGNMVFKGVGSVSPAMKALLQETLAARVPGGVVDAHDVSIVVRGHTAPEQRRRLLGASDEASTVVYSVAFTKEGVQSAFHASMATLAKSPEGNQAFVAALRKSGEWKALVGVTLSEPVARKRLHKGPLVQPAAPVDEPKAAPVASAPAATGATGATGASDAAAAKPPPPPPVKAFAVKWEALAAKADASKDVIVLGEEVARQMKVPTFEEASKLLGALVKKYMTHELYVEALTRGKLVEGKQSTALWGEIAAAVATNPLMADVVKLKLAGKAADAFRESMGEPAFGNGFVTRAQWDAFLAKDQKAADATNAANAANAAAPAAPAAPAPAGATGATGAATPVAGVAAVDAAGKPESATKTGQKKKWSDWDGDSFPKDTVPGDFPSLQSNYKDGYAKDGWGGPKEAKQMGTPIKVKDPLANAGKAGAPANQPAEPAAASHDEQAQAAIQNIVKDSLPAIAEALEKHEVKVAAQKASSPAVKEAKQAKQAPAATGKALAAALGIKVTAEQFAPDNHDWKL